MEPTNLFVALPPEVDKYLAQHRTSLGHMLKQQGITVRESHEPDPFKTDERNAAQRDMALVLASTAGAAAVITALGIALNNILKTMNKKPVMQIARRRRVVKDAQGNLVFGPNGYPLYEIDETPVLLEPRAEDSTAGMQFQAGEDISLVIGATHQEKP